MTESSPPCVILVSHLVGSLQLLRSQRSLCSSCQAYRGLLVAVRQVDHDWDFTDSPDICCSGELQSLSGVIILSCRQVSFRREACCASQMSLLLAVRRCLRTGTLQTSASMMSHLLVSQLQLIVRRWRSAFCRWSKCCIATACREQEPSLQHQRSGCLLAALVGRPSSSATLHRCSDPLVQTTSDGSGLQERECCDNSCTSSQCKALGPVCLCY